MSCCINVLQCVYRSETWMKRIYTVLHDEREPNVEIPLYLISNCVYGWRYTDLEAAKTKLRNTSYAVMI